MLSGSRALEFLGCQGVTALSHLVLSRRDSLLLYVRSTVPAEEVACLRYAALPSSAGLFPTALLDVSSEDSPEVFGGAGPCRINVCLFCRPRWRISCWCRCRRRRPRRPLPLRPPSRVGSGRGAKVRRPFRLAPAVPVANVGVPGRNPPDRVSPLLRVGGLPVSAMEAPTGYWGRVLGAVRPMGRISHPLSGLSSFPRSHPDIVPDFRSGSPRSLVLCQEIEKMLAKDALEIVLDLGPGFYSCLFLVEKATGRIGVLCSTSLT